MSKVDWNKNSSNLLKAELAKLGISYEELAERLKAIDVQETYQSIAAKINRGTFSFAFFMQCMKALEKTKISLD